MRFSALICFLTAIPFFAKSQCPNPPGDQVTYGTNNVWIGYVYNNQNFGGYRGFVNEGVAANPNFDENFGGANTTYNTNNCSVTTESFSVRYKLMKVFANGSYTFTVGADDGYRFSLDGGTTWVIDNWTDHTYTTSTYTTTLNGSINMVLEYYENTLANRVSFSVSASMLPVTITSFKAVAKSLHVTQIDWTTEAESNIRTYVVQKSHDGSSYEDIGTVLPNDNRTANKYGFTYEHQETFSGATYFRVKIFDKDGSIKYTNVALVNPSSDNFAMSVYPNPVHGQEFFWNADKNRSNVTIKIFSMQGTLIQARQYPRIEKGVVLKEILRSTQAGYYRISVSDGEGVFLNRLILKN